MKCTLPRSPLEEAVRLCVAVADRKSTMPILANVLLRTERSGRVTCAATDLNVALTAETAAEVEQVGSITVGAKLFHDIVKQLPTEKISVEMADQQSLRLRSGRIDYTIKGLSARTFPKLPDLDGVHFFREGAGMLCHMINSVIFSISSDITRPHIGGAFLEAQDDRWRVTSTDGRRLSRFICRMSPCFPPILIPHKGLIEIRRFIDGADLVDIACNEQYIYVRIDTMVLSVKLLAEQFPPVDAIIAQEQAHMLTVERQVLLHALKRISIMSSDKTYGVKLSVEPNLLRVQSDNPDIGQSREELDVDYAGPALTVGVNAQYLIDPLSTMGCAKVRLTLLSEIDPIVLSPSTSEDYLAVIMPMRI